jgi:catechol 2,3-dioxygenase-like lactoylglutathione lyase family enzyme
MTFDHVAVVNKDEGSAERFYRGLLGLDKIKESSVSSELAEQLFSFKKEIKMLVYGMGDLRVEVFIVSGFTLPSPPVPHICLMVPDRPGLLDKAKREGLKVIEANRGSHMVYFLEDFSGNRIEIKQQ